MSRPVAMLFFVVCGYLSLLSAAEPCPAGWTFNAANNHCYNLEATGYFCAEGRGCRCILLDAHKKSSKKENPFRVSRYHMDIG